MKYTISGYDAWGKPVSEEVDISPAPVLTIVGRVKRFIMRFAPSAMWNVWYRMGWTKMRRITRIAVRAANIAMTEK